jgi:hypothetical protein
MTADGIVLVTAGRLVEPIEMAQGDRMAALTHEQRHQLHQSAGRCRFIAGSTRAAYGGLPEAPGT